MPALAPTDVLLETHTHRILGRLVAIIGTFPTAGIEGKQLETLAPSRTIMKTDASTEPWISACIRTITAEIAGAILVAGVCRGRLALTRFYTLHISVTNCVLRVFARMITFAVRLGTILVDRCDGLLPALAPTDVILETHAHRIL